MAAGLLVSLLVVILFLFIVWRGWPGAFFRRRGWRSTSFAVFWVFVIVGFTTSLGLTIYLTSPHSPDDAARSGLKSFNGAVPIASTFHVVDIQQQSPDVAIVRYRVRYTAGKQTNAGWWQGEASAHRNMLGIWRETGGGASTRAVKVPSAR
ncbi:MAG: hypothetical protein NVS4B2_25240 [Chloroflexota bacterium]